MNYRKYLPQIDFLIRKAKEFGFTDNPNLLKTALRNLVERQKKLILMNNFKEDEDLFSDNRFKDVLKKEIERIGSPVFKRVINATGTIIHTNLGRAPLSREIIEEITPFLCNYSSLEFNIDTGKRGSRQDNLSPKLFNSEDILLVNNNAAACLLVLSTLAKGKEVIVSRSELVEIGGSFRIPEVMELSGCIMREVGTTNKTKLSDYERAISDNTGLILKVHRSNFVIEGFVEEVSTKELSRLAKRFNTPFYFDVGSGALKIIKSIDKNEPIIDEAINDGADIISFSTDKLLGGCQGGVIIGKSSLIEKMKKHPLYRAVRPDKITIYYLERLFHYLSLGDYFKSPVLEMIFSDIEKIKKRAQKVLKEIRKIESKEVKVDLVQDISTFGGGSLPLKTLPTYVIRLKSGESEEKIKKFFLNYSPPILIRQKEGFCIIDFRTIRDDEVPIITKAIKDFLLL